MLAPAGVVGEVEDVLPRGGQVGADGEVFGVFEEALAGGILPQAVGEAGLVVLEVGVAELAQGCDHRPRSAHCGRGSSRAHHR